MKSTPNAIRSSNMMFFQQACFAVAVISCLFSISADAFSVVPAAKTITAYQQQLERPISVSAGKTLSSSQLYMIDPISLGVAVGSAAVGAFSGAMSQESKLKKLEREHIETAKMALLEKELEIVHKLNELKDKLYNTIDYEYDNSSDKFKKKYNRSNRNDIEDLKNKIKDDLMAKYRFNLTFEPLTKTTKSKYELVCINEREFFNEMNSAIKDTGNKQQADLHKLVENINSKITLLDEANVQLDQALINAESELESMRAAINDQKGGLLKRLLHRKKEGWDVVVSK